MADYRCDDFLAYPKTLRDYFLGAAREYYAIGKKTSGRRCIWKAFRLTPYAFAPWKLLVLLELNKFLPEKTRRKLFTTLRHGYRPPK